MLQEQFLKMVDFLEVAPGRYLKMSSPLLDTWSTSLGPEEEGSCKIS